MVLLSCCFRLLVPNDLGVSLAKSKISHLLRSVVPFPAFPISLFVFPCLFNLESSKTCLKTADRLLFAIYFAFAQSFDNNAGRLSWCWKTIRKDLAPVECRGVLPDSRSPAPAPFFFSLLVSESSH